MDFVAQPIGRFRLGDYLLDNLQNKQWSLFRISVAFVKNSGVKHIYSLLSDFQKRGQCKISVGIDNGVTTYEGLVNLLDAIGSKSELWIFHNENSSSFHPKVYLFANDQSADFIVGSGNLTEGGLFTNYEAFLRVSLDLQNIEDKQQYDEIISYLDYWIDPSTGCAIQAALPFLNDLRDNEYLPTENQIRQARKEKSQQARERGQKAKGFKPYKSTKVPSAPYQPAIPVQLPEFVSVVETSKNIAIAEPVEEQDGLFMGFVMTLQQTDVGYGQKTAGASRRSPEIFIPLKARDEDPIFWGWRALFVQDPSKLNKYDRRDVKMLVRGNIESINMMTWPLKHDFRLRSESLRRGANPGDILRIERSDGTAGYQYVVEIISSTDPNYTAHLDLCSRSTGKPNSNKQWGYY
jgi:HKD family nuclease